MNEVQHSSRAHARLGASSSHRWMMCPPSVKLSEQFEDRPSPYAEEGTFLHELCELKLHRYLGDMYSWCFDGEPVGGTVAVSSVGTQKSKDARRMFLDGYNEMMARLAPTKIIFFGDVPKECEGNIEHHAPYYETFTRSLPFHAR